MQLFVFHSDIAHLLKISYTYNFLYFQKTHYILVSRVASKFYTFKSTHDVMYPVYYYVASKHTIIELTTFVPLLKVQ